MEHNVVLLIAYFHIRNVFSIQIRRLWQFKFSIDTLKRKHVSGHALAVLRGHITWAMMLRREGLALLHHVYEFRRLHRGSSTALCRCDGS